LIGIRSKLFGQADHNIELSLLSGDIHWCAAIFAGLVDVCSKLLDQTS
jgi:hypothetical protein